MRVIALVEYELVGEEGYTYIEEWDAQQDNWTYMVWKKRFIRYLLRQGKVCKYIKELRVKYVRNQKRKSV